MNPPRGRFVDTTWLHCDRFHPTLVDWIHIEGTALDDTVPVR